MKTPGGEGANLVKSESPRRVVFQTRGPGSERSSVSLAIGCGKYKSGPRSHLTLIALQALHTAAATGHLQQGDMQAHLLAHGGQVEAGHLAPHMHALDQQHHMAHHPAATQACPFLSVLLCRPQPATSGSALQIYNRVMVYDGIYIIVCVLVNGVIV